MLITLWSMRKKKSWFGEDKSRYIRYVVDKSTNYRHDDNDGRGKYKLDPLSARNYYEPYTFTFENGVEWHPPSGSYPRYSQKTLRRMEKEGRIDFSGNEPRAKRYLSEVQEGQPPDVFLSPEIVGFNSEGTSELRNIFGEGGVFAQPKPVRFVKFLLELLRSKDAIILDSFAGSGTTAHAVLALNKEDGGNRKFILIEREDFADDTTAERVRRVINGVENAKDQNLKDGLGGSFTYCTLGETIDEISMLTGETLPDYEMVANYIAYVATGNREFTPIKKCKDYCFGETESILFYLIYEPTLEFMQSRDSALNYELARKIENACKNADKKAYVYASHKNISQKNLTDMQITFCQLPYNIYRIKE